MWEPVKRKAKSGSALAKWFTVGYVDRMASLISDTLQDNPSHYHGYLADLLRQIAETLRHGHVPGAVVAVIWRGQLSRQAALYSDRAQPIHHVFADGRITGNTA